MPQNNGPFSAYLTEPARQSSVPNPSGFEGQAASIAHIGSKFLEGLRQGRLQKAAMAEMENAKTERAIEQAIQHVSSMEGVDPAVKQHYQNQLVQQYLGHIGGQKETSKDTGHPMTDMLKNVAISMSGGQLPTKVKPGLDLNLVGEAMTAFNDPSNRVDQKLSRLNADIQTALKSGNVNDIRTAYGNPAISQYLNEGRRLTGKADWMPDVFQSLAQDPAKARQEQIQLSALNSPLYNEVLGGQSGSPSPAQTPVSSTPPSMGQPAPSAQPSAAPQQAPASGFLEAVSAARNAKAKRDYVSKTAGVGLPPADDLIPDLTKPESYVDEQNNRFNGIFNPVEFKGFKPGVYNASTGAYTPNATKASLYNPERAAANKPLTPEQQQEMLAKLSRDVDIAITDKGLATGAKAAISAQLASGDTKGAADLIARYQQINQSMLNSQAAQRASAALAAASQSMARTSMGFQVAQQFNTSEPVKKMRVIDAYTNDVNSAYQQLKAGGDPGIYDLEIMRAWAKITDPLTGVREGEYRDIAGIQGPWRDFQTKVQRIMDSNGGKLDDASRESIVNAINRIHKNQYETQFKPVLDQYQRSASAAGLGAQPLFEDVYANRNKGRANPVDGVAKPALIEGAPPRRSGKSATPPGVRPKPVIKNPL